MSLVFVTLYAKNVEETAILYRILGLAFVEEQHGVGPVHLAATAVGIALEIYPGQDGNCPGLLLGFETVDLDDIREQLLAAGIRLESDIAERNGFRRLIALDADSRRVLVSQRGAIV